MGKEEGEQASSKRSRTRSAGGKPHNLEDHTSFDGGPDTHQEECGPPSPHTQSALGDSQDDAGAAPKVLKQAVLVPGGLGPADAAGVSQQHEERPLAADTHRSVRGCQPEVHTLLWPAHNPAGGILPGEHLPAAPPDPTSAEDGALRVATCVDHPDVDEELARVTHMVDAAALEPQEDPEHAPAHESSEMTECEENQEQASEPLSDSESSDASDEEHLAALTFEEMLSAQMMQADAYDEEEEEEGRGPWCASGSLLSVPQVQEILSMMRFRGGLASQSDGATPLHGMHLYSCHM